MKLHYAGEYNGDENTLPHRAGPQPRPAGCWARRASVSSGAFSPACPTWRGYTCQSWRRQRRRSSKAMLHPHT